MTTAPATPTVPELSAQIPVTKRTTLTFTYDGFQMTAREPKAAWQINLQLRYGGEDPDGMKQWAAINETLEKVFDPATVEHIRKRLDDDDDDFDFDTLIALSQWCRSQWSPDPTGPKTGSSTRSRRTGVRSTAQ